jgi:RNA polymerase sigma-70 factor (ECF subfamily)
VTPNLNAAPDSPVSYEDLYAAHYAEVLRLCRLLLANHHDAEEVAQEVFLKAHQQYHNLDQPMMWRAWLARVSVNACRDRRRSGWWKWWRGADEYQEANYPSSSKTPEEMLLGRETQGRIWRAFEGLSARQQEVFVLRYVDEWSTEQVAEMLGITTGSVKRYLFRAVRHLRRVLGDRR